MKAINATSTNEPIYNKININFIFSCINLDLREQAKGNALDPI